MVRVADDVSDVETFLELEALAVAPYASFVHTDEAEARRVARRLLEEGVAEFAPPAGFGVVTDDGALVAMVAGPLVPAELTRSRLRATRIIMKLVGPDTIARMKIAGETLLKLDAGDAYLSRIAVVPGRRRQGIARFALDAFLSRARAREAKRAVLEVGADEASAIALYRSAGFDAVDERRVVTPDGRRTLAYVHMTLPL